MNTKIRSIVDVEERRMQSAFDRLGTDEPRCLHCGEDYWGCLELHHIAGRGYDDMTGILCRNCHRKMSDPTNNFKVPADVPIMEQIGKLLIGLADFFAALIEKFRAFGSSLLEGSQECPRPWGWLEGEAL